MEIGRKNDEIAQLERENAALLADARRYRWLRDEGDGTMHVYLGMDEFSLIDSELDAAIDAAMKEKA